MPPPGESPLKIKQNIGCDTVTIFQVEVKTSPSESNWKDPGREDPFPSDVGLSLPLESPEKLELSAGYSRRGLNGESQGPPLK